MSDDVPLFRHKSTGELFTAATFSVAGIVRLQRLAVDGRLLLGGDAEIDVVYAADPVNESAREMLAQAAQVLADDVEGELLVHFRDWLARFKEHLVGGHYYTDAAVFAEKIERVLLGEDDFGVMPCILCGMTNTQRYLIGEERRENAFRMPGDHREVLPSRRHSVCYDHHLQSRESCVCGAVLWSEQLTNVDWCWFSDVGKPINCCPECGVRLVGNEADNRERLREIFAAAGFVRGGLGR